MGKGLIISHDDAGRYQVKLLLDVSRVTARITVINLQIDYLANTVIPALQTEKATALSNKTNALTEMNTTITAYIAGTATKEEVEAATKKYNDALSAYSLAAQKLRMKELEKTSFIKNKEYLQAHTPVNPTVSAWCADLTTNLSGQMGIIEIPGERGTVHIQPGYSGGAVYNAARDGILQPGIAGTAASVFLNQGLLPGWQKYLPTYRIGEILSITNDLATVSLDSAVSSAQRLLVNQSDTLYNIPFQYMVPSGEIYTDINDPPFPSYNYINNQSAVFSVGDRVVVKFQNQDWSMPVIVGFETHPRQFTKFNFRVYDYTGRNITNLWWEWATGTPPTDYYTIPYNSWIFTVDWETMIAAPYYDSGADLLRVPIIGYSDDWYSKWPPYKRFLITFLATASLGGASENETLMRYGSYKIIFPRYLGPGIQYFQISEL